MREALKMMSRGSINPSAMITHIGSLNCAGIDPLSISAIGITNQRETCVVWDAATGKPVMNALVWQDKRTSNICEQLKAKGLQEYVRENTGLIIDSYFSGTKIKWIIDHIPKGVERAKKGELKCGTIDS